MRWSCPPMVASASRATKKMRNRETAMLTQARRPSRCRARSRGTTGAWGALIDVTLFFGAMSERLGVTVPLPGFSVRGACDLARRAEDLGYTDAWSSEVSGPDGFSV